MNNNRNRIVALLIVVFLASVFIQCTKDREPTAPTEIQRPKSLAITPVAGDLAIPIDAKIDMVFDEPMDLSTFPGHFTLKDLNGNLIDGSFSPNDSIVLFTPFSPLNKSSFYFTELRGRVRDSHRNSIEFNNEPILDDTTLLLSSWFYTEGDYSSGGYYNIYVRDKKDGRIVFLSNLDSVLNPVTSLSSPEGLALSDDGNHLIISNTSKNEVVIASAVDGSILKTIAVAANPTSCVSLGNYAYIVSVNGRVISKINLSTQALENSIALNFYPGKLAISLDGSTLYTYDQVTRDLVLINSDSGAIIKRVKTVVTSIVVGEIRVDAASGNVYICDSKGRKIKVTDPQGNTVQDYLTFGTGVEPIDIVFYANDAFVLAGNSAYKFEKLSAASLDTLTFSTGVKSLCVVPSGDIIYVTLATNVAMIDYKTSRVLKEIDLISTGINTIISNSKKF
jgi:sugar lactone lactonase YvrE